MRVFANWRLRRWPWRLRFDTERIRTSRVLTSVTESRISSFSLGTRRRLASMEAMRSMRQEMSARERVRWSSVTDRGSYSSRKAWRWIW